MKKLFILSTVLCLGSFSAFAENLNDALTQSSAGLRAQSMRMKVISQNIANANSTGSTPGAQPYRRKTITFRNIKNPQTGAEVVTVDNIGTDKKTAFKAMFDPSHPAADINGYVLLPNVDTSIESLDMKESQRSYEANLGALKTTKGMIESTIDLLR